MDVANASLYDGGSAMAEAVIMATAATNRSKIIIAETVNPLHRQVVDTYHAARPVEILTVRRANGQIDLEHLKSLVNDQTACVVISQPNLYGMLEDIQSIEPIVHAVGAKLILSVEPVAQLVLTTPGELGVDIVCGEGQPLGIPMSFGGPTFGFFAVKKELIRLLPGRLAARTTDVDGKPGYVLTLQTREQHIRRDKATSNICTNQAFCATMATAYLSLLGKEGMKEVALLSMERAQYFANAISKYDGFSLYWNGPFVRELAIRTPKPAKEIIAAMVERHGILPGVDAGQWDESLRNCLIVAFTEKRTFAEIDQFVTLLSHFSTANVAETVA
jgi:glycine dehydrogenase subunit 1